MLIFNLLSGYCSAAYRSTAEMRRAMFEWRKRMPENSIRIVARVVANRDSVEQVRSILSDLVEPTRNESGCISYELLQNRTDQTDW